MLKCSVEINIIITVIFVLTLVGYSKTDLVVHLSWLIIEFNVLIKHLNYNRVSRKIEASIMVDKTLYKPTTPDALYPIPYQQRLISNLSLSI